MTSVPFLGTVSGPKFCCISIVYLFAFGQPVSHKPAMHAAQMVHVACHPIVAVQHELLLQYLL